MIPISEFMFIVIGSLVLWTYLWLIANNIDVKHPAPNRKSKESIEREMEETIDGVKKMESVKKCPAHLTEAVWS